MSKNFKSTVVKDKLLPYCVSQKLPEWIQQCCFLTLAHSPKLLASPPASWFNIVHPKFVWGFQHAVNFQYRERNLGYVKYQTLIQTLAKNLRKIFASHFVSVIHLHKQLILVLYIERNLVFWLLVRLHDSWCHCENHIAKVLTGRYFTTLCALCNTVQSKMMMPLVTSLWQC